MDSNLPSKILVLLIIGMFTVAPSVLAANHSLEWGVEVGEEFTYALQRKTFDPSFVLLMPYWLGFLLDLDAGDLFTATVMELEFIPDNISDTENLPLAHVTLEKDTQTLEIDSTGFVIPIGDWDLQTERLNLSAHPDTTLIDTETEWGTSEESSFTTEGYSFSYSFEWRYDKTNGTLTYAKYSLATIGSTLIDIVVVQWTEGIPTVIPDDLQLSTVLIIAVGGIMGIVVAILVYRWVKAPKGLAAELGK
ncbi:MAG: hypothetical protein ACFFF4_17320 [Candidatus Thorarchaeota archaeon]